MDTVTCGGCLWWTSDTDDAAEGQCHRYAPRATTTRSGVVWPTTARLDFCGDVEPKPDTTPIECH